MKKLILSSLLLLGINFVILAQSGKAIPAAEFYPGGQQAMYSFIDEHKVYPILAKKNRISGDCIVNFILNEDGTISSPQVVKNIGGGCGQEALRVVKLLKFKPPGYKIQTSIPVYFKL